MCKSIAVLVVTSLAAAATAGLFNKPLKKNTPGKSTFTRKPSKGKLPVFRSGDYALALENLESRSKVVLAERGNREYTIRLEGTMTAPKGEDAVAVTKQLKVLAVLDSEKRSLRQIKKPTFRGFGTAGSARRPTPYQGNTYASIHDGQADVEVPLTKLRANAYAVASMDLAATVILAKEREGKKVPAAVSASFTEIVPGLSLRITKLEMSADRKLSIATRYKRPKAGPVGPFVEHVCLLDKEGKIIGRARWKRGDLFGAGGTVSGEMSVPEGRTYEAISFIACTKFERKPVKFTVTGLFQR